MKKRLNLLFAIAVIGILAIVYAAPDWIVDPPIHRDAVLQPDDKFDSPCTGHETAGRCADKCPPDQYLQGYDKDTGRAICHYNQDPSQQTPPSTSVYNAIEPVAPASADYFTGK